VNTGIALANPANQDATVTFYFTDGSGVDFRQDSFILRGNSQIAAFLNQGPFDGGASIHGSFTFTSTIPISVIALRGYINERGEFLITTLPVSSTASMSTEPVVLSHFADGGGWTTQLILTNPSDAQISGTIQFTNSTGVPESSLYLNGVNTSVSYYSIPPRASVRMITGNTTTDIRTGSVQITPTDGVAPTALGVFSLKIDGVTVTEAGVAALPKGLSFRMYAEVSGDSGQIGAVESGLAIANRSQTPVSVTLQLISMDGSSPLAAVTLTVPANGQISRFIRQLFPSLTSPFAGFLKASSATPIGVTGLRGRYNERGDFLITTTPARNEAVRDASSGLVFPHVVLGGGYTTEVILYGDPASGNVAFRSQNGAPLASMQRLP